MASWRESEEGLSGGTGVGVLDTDCPLEQGKGIRTPDDQALPHELEWWEGGSCARIPGFQGHFLHPAICLPIHLFLLPCSPLSPPVPP